MKDNYGSMLNYSPKDRSHRDEHFAPIYYPIATIFIDDSLERVKNEEKNIFMIIYTFFYFILFSRLS